MSVKKIFSPLVLTSAILLVFSSCNKEYKKDNYTAYFGGEVSNPTNPYVLFCKDSKVIDSALIDKNNRFFIKFDSLASGMYSFKNEPEYQYVYFDKNDSIMVRINAKKFDESVVYCGRGDEKNNFLMEQYLSNENEKSKLFNILDYDFEAFNKNIDSCFAQSQKFYNTKKEVIKWSDGFDVYAKAALDFNYFSKKELYPVVHKIRTGNDVYENMPKDYYAYRKNIDFNNTDLEDYAPFVLYLNYILNNLGSINYHNHFSKENLSLKTNINKLVIADTLIKNEKLKNNILNSVAFNYLLEDQNMVNHQKFFETYYKFSTDKSNSNEILKIGQAIQLLKVGNVLPTVDLVDEKGTVISSNSLIKNKTVLFFWTYNSKSHFVFTHKKVLALKSKYPNYDFIAVNLDENQTKWTETLNEYKFKGVKELRCFNFEDLKNKWAIIKLQRTIILNNNAIIKNAFTNLFSIDFEKNMK